KRSSYYSDYTFGVWRGDELVPVGKAYFGFTDQELAFLDRWIRNHTVARFGPVREVEKSLILEVAFDAAQLSSRHKSGVALRFPRIARIRTDKPAAEADRLESLMALVERKGVHAAADCPDPWPRAAISQQQGGIRRCRWCRITPDARCTRERWRWASACITCAVPRRRRSPLPRGM